MTSGLAAVCLGIVFWSRWRVRPSGASLSKLGYLAVLDLVASALGFWGARQVDLSTSAFLLALCVVGVPVVLVVKRRPVPGRTWVGIAVILLGLALAGKSDLGQWPGCRRSSCWAQPGSEPCTWSA